MSRYRDDEEENQQETEQQSSRGALTRSAGSGGTLARQTMSGEELEVSGETAGAILAAQAKAMVEARFIVAMKRPRDWDVVRIKMLKACERPGFAEGYLDPGVTDKKKAIGAAWYNKPIGDGVQGFSIRFAEEAMRAMGNLDIQTVTIYDDEQKRILSVVVTDLENNIALPTSILVEKTVERRKLGRGAEVIRQRVNSFGDTLYIIPATEDEVFQKQQSLSSKAIRNQVLRLLPGDIQAECRQRILQIRQGAIAKDPDKARRAVVDAFATLNVMADSLKEYLGHDLAESTPAEIQDLRDLYSEIREGNITWRAALDSVLDERKNDEETEEREQPKKVTTQSVRERRLAREKAATESTATKTAPAEEEQQQEAAPPAKGRAQQPAPVEAVSNREPGDEEEVSPEEEKRLDIEDLIKEFMKIEQRMVAAEIIELYGETRLSAKRKDADTIAEIPDANLNNVKSRLEKRLRELKK